MQNTYFAAAFFLFPLSPINHSLHLENAGLFSSPIAAPSPHSLAPPLRSPASLLPHRGYQLQNANVMDIAADHEPNPPAAPAAGSAAAGASIPTHQYITHQDEMQWVQVPVTAATGGPAAAAAGGGFGPGPSPSSSSETWNVLMSIGEGSYGLVELVSCRTGHSGTGAPPAPVVIKKSKEGFHQVSGDRTMCCGRRVYGVLLV